MKDNLFEILLNLFEKTLTHLKEQHDSSSEELSLPKEEARQGQFVFVKKTKSQSIRVFTPSEQMKLTKASYQFIMRLASWGILATEVLELILDKLFFSESRFVTLQETKWTIRNTLASGGLHPDQLAFLDLVLYHKEDSLSLH